ncbi:MAG: DUF6390 family protein [Candidatus Dormibacteraceae bacterium]
MPACVFVPRELVTARGALLFGRYAFPPNQLGYCGPPDHQALLDHVAAGAPDRGLVELERRFEGAYPYLVLIAQANGIADPFDERVVEAYWVGNNLLNKVEAGGFRDSLHERFGPRMDSRSFHWLTTKLTAGARPHHNFHVFDVYVRAGLMNDERATIALDLMDSCRVSWGTVTAGDGDDLLVERQPLTLAGGKLALGETVSTRVTRQQGGQGFVGSPAAGSTVSIHWNWACDVLDAGALRRLQRATARCLDLANQTI